MGATFSVDKVFCPDYLRRHKKKITKQRNFRSVQDLGVNPLMKILLQETSTKVKETDYLYRTCFQHFSRKIQRVQETSNSLEDAFIPDIETVEKLNRYLYPTQVSPLKPPSQVKSRCRGSRGRKQARRCHNHRWSYGDSKVIGHIRRPRTVAKGLQQVRRLDTALSARTRCTCFEAHQEHCRLLTLFLPSLTRTEIDSIVPEATRYIIDKSRKLRDYHGVWSIPDPH